MVRTISLRPAGRNDIYKELESIHLELIEVETGNDSLKITNSFLKLRIAMISLKIINFTSLTRKNIFSKAYDLSIFCGFDYEDELNDIFEDIFHLASRPPHRQESNMIIEWEKIRLLLESYINEHAINIS